MKKLIPFIALLIGVSSEAQIRFESSNPKGRVSIEVGSGHQYNDRYYASYLRPYDYLRLTARQEALLYDRLYALERQRLNQRVYDEMLYRDLQRILNRHQFRSWENRYYAPRYYKKHHKPHHKSHHKGKGYYKGKGHHKHHRR